MNILVDGKEEEGRLRFLGTARILQRKMNSLADAQILLGGTLIRRPNREERGG